MPIPIIELKAVTVTYQDSNQVRDVVFNKVMQYFIENEIFDGESLMQSDTASIEAAASLANIADDILQFNVTYNEI